MADPGAAVPAQPEPSSTPTPVDATAALEHLTPTQRATWRETGTLPDSLTVVGREPVQAADPEDDAEPAKAAADANSTAVEIDPDILPLIDTPPPPGVSKRQHYHNQLVRVANERARENAELKAKLAQPRAVPAAVPAPPVPPSPPPAAGAWDGSDPRDPAPTIEQFADALDPYKAHIKAELAWDQRKAERLASVTAAQRARQTEIATREQTYVERMVAYEQVNPTFPTVVAPFLTYLRAEIAQAPDAPLAHSLIDSPVSPQLVEHFATHPDDWNALLQLTPREQIRAFTKLETRFESIAATTAAPASAGTPAPPRETSAPEPPTVLGSRPTAPADEVTAAVRDRDTGRYIRAANARALAAART